MLLRQLDRSRFEPMLLCPPELIEMLRPDLPGDVEAIPITLRAVSHVTAAAGLASLLRKRGVQILHSHMFQASKFASPIGWLCRVPVVVETTHVREHWRRGWLKSHYFVDRLVGRSTDALIAVSEANRDYLVHEKGMPDGKVFTIRNGCDTGKFHPGRSVPIDFKRALGFQDCDPVAVVLARLEPQKGHGVLLQAWSAVQKRFSNARLVCVGDGSLTFQLKSQAQRLGIAESVRFVGYQSNTPEWLALADFTILPSFYEGLPLVAIESLASARAVVATAVDGTTEVVRHGKTGLTVPPGEPVSLANAICQIIGDPAMRISMGSAGRRLVEVQFSQAKQVSETEELYTRCWSRKPWRSKTGDIGLQHTALDRKPQ
jgi:glycosyltransferase involved in cell wall biosynthesis